MLSISFRSSSSKTYRAATHALVIYYLRLHGVRNSQIAYKKKYEALDWHSSRLLCLQYLNSRLKPLLYQYPVGELGSRANFGSARPRTRRAATHALVFFFFFFLFFLEQLDVGDAAVVHGEFHGGVDTDARCIICSRASQNYQEAQSLGGIYRADLLESSSKPAIFENL
jgi:hypothetical protein